MADAQTILTQVEEAMANVTKISVPLTMVFTITLNDENTQPVTTTFSMRMDIDYPGQRAFITIEETYPEEMLVTQLFYANNAVWQLVTDPDDPGEPVWERTDIPAAGFADLFGPEGFFRLFQIELLDPTTFTVLEDPLSYTLVSNQFPQAFLDILVGTISQSMEAQLIVENAQLIFEVDKTTFVIEDFEVKASGTAIVEDQNYKFTDLTTGTVVLLPNDFQVVPPDELDEIPANGIETVQFGQVNQAAICECYACAACSACLACLACLLCLICLLPPATAPALSAASLPSINAAISISLSTSLGVATQVVLNTRNK